MIKHQQRRPTPWHLQQPRYIKAKTHPLMWSALIIFYKERGRLRVKTRELLSKTPLVDTHFLFSIRKR